MEIWRVREGRLLLHKAMLGE